MARLVSLLLFLAMAVLVCFAEVDVADKLKFDNFLKDYKLSFKGEEYGKRLGIFMSNMKRIAQLTKVGTKGNFGINRFAATTPEEFQRLLMPLDFENTVPLFNDTEHPIPDAPSRRKRQSIPYSYDYRSQGWVTSIKNQGSCGACWAFATAALMETTYLRALGSSYNYDLSEQLLVDCNYPTNNACSGGWVNSAIEYIRSYGMTQEYYYSYVGYRQTCKSISSSYRFSGINYFQINSEADIPYYLYTYGPVSFYFKVPSSFQHYTGGVFDVADCTTGTQGLHEITIVGYTPTYWIVKNSWGTTFGDQGYVYFKRGKNLCNMQAQLLCVYYG
jgi:hypothetical protein